MYLHTASQLEPPPSGYIRYLRIHRRHVGDDLCAILSDPLEGSVNRLVELAPRQLLREEEVATGEAAELRQLGAVPERVGKPGGAELFSLWDLKAATCATYQKVLVYLPKRDL